MQLKKDIEACTACKESLPCEPKPIVRFARNSKILIIGQAPSKTVQETGVPWDDASGKRLRSWLQVTEEAFYNEALFAIVPMGFCYPGKGKSGDLPPRPECAPLWHERVINELPKVELILLIGQYAQKHYCKDSYKTITGRIKNWQEFYPQMIPLPHPSPRNQLWLRKNAWFEKDVLPKLQIRVQKLIAK